jgi:hypothetical protein
MKESYGSEGERIAHKVEYGRRAGNHMANGDGRISWELILKISQVAIYPLLAAMLYMLMQMNGIDRRLAVLEVTTARPQADVDLVRKIAVIEDRQGAVMKQLSENGDRMDRISDALAEHDYRAQERTWKRVK